MCWRASLKSEPDWKAVPSDLDPRIQSLLRRCLTKDRKNRLQAIGEARIAVEQYFAEPDAAVARERTSSLRAVVLAAVASAVVTGIIVWGVTRPGPRLPTRFAMTLPATDQLGLSSAGTVISAIALSPDGRNLVHVATRDGVTELYRRAMDQLEAVPIRGTEDARAPFFSPDGEWIGFYAGGNLKKVSLAGGPPVTLCRAVAGSWAVGSWGVDDVIVFVPARGSPLMQVSASGGVPEPVTTLGADGAGHYSPEILPGGNAVLFTVRSGGSLDTDRIAVQPLKAGEPRILVDGTNPRYAPTGHIIFARANSLWAVPFDANRLEVTGEPTPVLEGLQTYSAGLAQFALAGDGSLAYVPRLAQATRMLVWVDRNGGEETLPAEPRAYVYPRVSPDGSRLALEVRDEEDNDIWIWDFARQTLSRFTVNPSRDLFPTWTPDSRQVAFSSDRNGPPNLYWKAADGTGAVEQLAESENSQFAQAFSPDGKELVYFEINPSGYDLGVVSVDSNGSSEPLLTSEFAERYPDLSPDGRWLAYQSDASGQQEIYVRPFPNVDEGRWPISTGGGTRPLWARDGSELFYLTPSSQLMVVPVRLEPSLDFGNPELVFEQPYPPFAAGRTYDVSPDGKRFLMIKAASGAGNETSAAQIIVVQNWFEELKRLVPTN